MHVLAATYSAAVARPPSWSASWQNQLQNNGRWLPPGLRGASKSDFEVTVRINGSGPISSFLRQKAKLTTWASSRNTRFLLAVDPAHFEAYFQPKDTSVQPKDALRSRLSFASWTSWYRQFQSEQRANCGVPVHPIDIKGDNRLRMHDVTDYSWPWMVSSSKLFHMLVV